MDFCMPPNYNGAKRDERLFTAQCYVSTGETRQKFEYLPLGFSDAAPHTAPVVVYIAAISPFSAHEEDAPVYVEYLATHMTDVARLALCPGKREPVPSESLPKSAAEFLARLNELDRRISSGGDASLEAARDEMINAHAEYFTATPRSIAACRKK